MYIYIYIQRERGRERERSREYKCNVYTCVSSTWTQDTLQDGSQNGLKITLKRGLMKPLKPSVKIPFKNGSNHCQASLDQPGNNFRPRSLWAFLPPPHGMAKALPPNQKSGKHESKQMLKCICFFGGVKLLLAYNVAASGVFLRQKNQFSSLKEVWRVRC